MKDAEPRPKNPFPLAAQHIVIGAHGLILGYSPVESTEAGIGHDFSGMAAPVGV